VHDFTFRGPASSILQRTRLQITILRLSGMHMVERRGVRLAVVDGAALHLGRQNRSLQFSSWISLRVLNIRLLDSVGGEGGVS
jgi:hypothetical protein